MFLSPIIVEAHILVTLLPPSHTKHFHCYVDSNTTLLEMKSHLNYNTINHDNLIRMDISLKLNGANIKQLKEQDNTNISTLRNVTVNKDKTTQCSRHRSKRNTTQLTTRRTTMSEE